MSQLSLVAIDVVAVSVLAFGLYFRRYRRRDIVVAIIGLNIGVLAVATALASSDLSVAFGFGLFGVLSIIRLRSAELNQEEVAYYFSALAIGLLGGVEVEPVWAAPLMIALVLVALFIADHPRVFPRDRRQVITLDQAHSDEALLTSQLEEQLGATVSRLTVRKLDMVKGTTVVDVRYRLDDSKTPSPPTTGVVPRMPPNDLER